MTKNLKKWKTIRCSQIVFDRLDAISKILNRKKSAFLDELFVELWESCNHLQDGNVMYTGNMGQLILNFYGKSNVIVGQRPVCKELAEKEASAQIITKIIPQKKFRLKGELKEND